jgi:5-formyltetrahydrofolate cyclo-ligase
MYSQKTDLRKKIRSMLNGTAADEIETKSRAIRERLMTIPPFQTARQTNKLMSFVSMPREVNTIPFFAGHSVIVPYCYENNIVPVRILAFDELEPGLKGILEPKPAVRQDKARQVMPEEIEAVLVPGLAFDHQGNRLGRGKGFYDRFLRMLPSTVLTIGVTFEQMICECVPVDDNDYPLQIIVTENRIIDAGKTMRKSFTLLEVLLASVLFAVLLGIVLSMTSFFIRSETQTVLQTEQQRIVSAWIQILNDDFRTAIQDTEQANKKEGNETIRHFGLYGTATQLRIDVSDEGQAVFDSSTLKTILYEFQPASGLMRREQDYAAAKTARFGNPAAERFSPEIVGCRFRYFDGNTWHEHWASLDRKGVPAAVEAVIQTLPLAEAVRWRNQMPHTVEPALNRIVVQIPAAPLSIFKPYQREEPPKPPVDPIAVTPPPMPQPLEPPALPPPPPMPTHSLFGDEKE